MSTPLRPLIAELRREYASQTLDESQVSADPIEQFGRWFSQALEADLLDPNAMTLATCGADGQPSARIVLLKEHDDQGFVFYTNYASRKGEEMAGNASAALLFYWGALERQVRIEGSVEKVSAAESDEYYQQRPLGARLGAWASAQSRVIDNRAALEARLDAVTAQYGDDPPRPPHWGGYRLRPRLLEFWQGRPNRLHDRVRYLLRNDMRWAIERLSP